MIRLSISYARYGLMAVAALAALALAPTVWSTHSETALGEIEGRAAPVSRRQCIGGPNVGDLCNNNLDCPASSCQDRNVYNMTVAVRFDASAAQMTAVQNAMSGMSASLFDATDGQAQLGLVTIVNNSLGSGGDVWVSPGGGLSANSGHWATGGRINAGINTLQFGAAPGEGMAHEFVHLVFDARDEYESRAAGCGGVVGGANCPTLPGEENCLMDQGGVSGTSTELCWAGNHEAALITEQSRCRSNRSCWEQVVHSWPTTFELPAGAPDPAAGGATVDPVVFFIPDNTARIVLVLDNSGSMSLESPSRMERLKTAASDFVNLAENGTELGIVSFSTTATDQVAIAALGANRLPWLNAISALTPTSRTNIGDGLQHALDMINAAGDATANTAIVLMTDGINNEPQPNPQADLNSKTSALLMAGVPVLVTCTGDDLGLNSQCEEIATATGGSYVDSADSADLPEAFTHFHELITGADMVAESSGVVLATKGSGGTPYTFDVEEGALGVTVLLHWNNDNTGTEFNVTDPTGQRFFGQPMSRGQYVRVRFPRPGRWVVDPQVFGQNDSWVSRAYVSNPNIGAQSVSRFRAIQPLRDMVVYALPSYFVPVTNCSVFGLVTDPDGEVYQVVLFDEGRDNNDTGDDIAGDGVYTATFRETRKRGPYSWRIFMDCLEPIVVQSHHPEMPPHDIPPKPFHREAMFTATVDDRPDADGDRIPDYDDNCIQVANPDQRDTDHDGIGNACDPDIAQPNDCFVNFRDLDVLAEAFFSGPNSPNWNPDAEFSGDSVINFIELGLMASRFFAAPGPSGKPNICGPDLKVQLVNPPTQVSCPGGQGTCVHLVDMEIHEVNGRDVNQPFSVTTFTDNGLATTFVVPGIGAGSTIPASTVLGPGDNCYNPNCLITVEVDSGGNVAETDETNNIDVRLDAG